MLGQLAFALGSLPSLFVLVLAFGRFRPRLDTSGASYDLYKLSHERQVYGMYAIIRTGGKQFRAEPGQTIRIPSLAAEIGEKVAFDDVLVARTSDEVRVGTPTVQGARVEGEVLAHGKGEKIVVFKWKRRKNYRRKQGHRQKYTEVQIEEIHLE